MKLLSIEIFIISWIGQHENAVNIANELEKEIDNKSIYIVYSDPNENYILNSSYNLLKRSNNLFWEDKFKTCLDNSKSDLMYVIHADCKSDDWISQIKRCQEIMSEDQKIGVWSPIIDYTDWHYSITTILELEEKSLNIVAQTDGIVFCINEFIQNRMRELNYQNNIYGWGINQFINAICFSKNFYSVVDKTQFIEHPKSRGYSSETASKGMKIFLKQMSIEEKIQHTLLIDFVKNKRKKLRREKERI